MKFQNNNLNYIKSIYYSIIVKKTFDIFKQIGVVRWFSKYNLLNTWFSCEL